MPLIRYLPSGSIWVLPETAGAAPLIFTSPIELANARHALSEVASRPCESAADILQHFYRSSPFLATRASIAPTADATPAFAEALAVLCDDRALYTRGEMDEYLIGQKTLPEGLQIAGISAKPRTLALRLADALDRIDLHAAEAFFSLEITRDPNAKDETAAPLVRETFAPIRGDARVMVDLSAGGGFVLRLTLLKEKP